MGRLANYLSRYKVEEMDGADRAKLFDVSEAVANRYLGGDFFENPAATRQAIKRMIGCREHEVFGVAFLTQQHQLMTNEVMFRGDVSSASIPPRQVTKRALEVNCCAVVIYHNHPSGSLKPSPDDLALTRKISECLRMFDIRLLDHFIVSPAGSISLAEQGLMP